MMAGILKTLLLALAATPWTVTIRQRLMPDSELIEFICAENEKDAQHFVK
jgi:hypothetical protein